MLYKVLTIDNFYKRAVMPERKVYMNKQRRRIIYEINTRLEAVQGEMESLLDDIQAVIDEETEYRDNIPENMQGGERYEMADSACDSLQSAYDTLESRRSRVQSRWFTSLPYTWRMLIQKLIALCGENDFTITKQFDFYRIDLNVHLELFGQVEELEQIIETMLPCNMVMDAKNSIPMKAEGVALAIGGVCFVNSYLITNDWQEKKTIEGNILIGSGVSESEKWMITNDEKRKDTISGSADFGGGLTYAAAYFITNDSRENMVVRGSAVHGAATINTVNVVITEDFNEHFDISGNGSVGSGVVTAEHIEIN